ncbi:hypothetical protein D3C83_157960 [compost metagenome]
MVSPKKAAELLAALSAKADSKLPAQRAVLSMRSPRKVRPAPVIASNTSQRVAAAGMCSRE